MTHHKEHDDGDVARHLDGLLETVRGLGGADEQRRELLLEQAEERGLDRGVAEQAYDIAREEKLLPAYGLALAMHRVSVQPFDNSSTQVETSEPNEPEWVDAPPPPEQADREWRFRQTFRRLRSHLEQAGDPAEAVRAFGQEPDLQHHRY